MDNQRYEIKNPFIRLFSKMIFYGIILLFLMTLFLDALINLPHVIIYFMLLVFFLKVNFGFYSILPLFLVALFLGKNSPALFVFLILFVSAFVIGSGIFNIIAPDKIIKYKYSKLIIIVICFISAFIMLEMMKRVDIDTCKKELQENFHISFQNVEIDSCKTDSSWSENVLYAEIIGNQTFFTKLSNFYHFSPHKSKIYYPTDFSIHSKIMSDDFNLAYRSWQDYKGNGSGFGKIIGCHSETFYCSFYFLSRDGSGF